jgi:hypothetical protein
VRQLAHRALSNYAHPAVRRLAIERLKASPFLESELELLSMNYQPGDASLIEHLLQVPADRDQLHHLICDLVRLYESNQVAESGRAMLFVYEESPCSNCRLDAFRVLVGTGTAPHWLLEECRHDSRDGIREIAARSKPSPCA